MASCSPNVVSDGGGGDIRLGLDGYVTLTKDSPILPVTIKTPNPRFRYKISTEGGSWVILLHQEGEFFSTIKEPILGDLVLLRNLDGSFEVYQLEEKSCTGRPLLYISPKGEYTMMSNSGKMDCTF